MKLVTPLPQKNPFALIAAFAVQPLKKTRSSLILLASVGQKAYHLFAYAR